MVNRNPSYPGTTMRPSRPTDSNGIEDPRGCDLWSAADGRTVAQESIAHPLERKHPLLGSRVAGPRTLTVIRPPSFALGTIVSGISNLVSYRDLLYTFTVFRLAVRYKQSILGWIWAALQPLGMMIVYTFVFSSLVRVRSEGMPYPLFVFSGLLPWIFFSGSVSNAINGMVSHSTLITKLYFPREIIPLSYVFAALVDFAISCAILFGLMLYYRAPLGWKILYTLPVVAILIAFTSAIALFLSLYTGSFPRHGCCVARRLADRSVRHASRLFRRFNSTSISAPVFAESCRRPDRKLPPRCRARIGPGCFHAPHLRRHHPALSCVGLRLFQSDRINDVRRDLIGMARNV